MNGWQKLWLVASAAWVVFLAWWLNEWRTASWAETLSDPLAWVIFALYFIVPPILVSGLGVLVRRVVR